jgi:flagellar basal body-associated protein FliL
MATAQKSKAPPPSRAGVTFFVLALAALGLGAWFWSSHKTDAAAEASHQVKGSLHLETFVMNLADRDARSYLRVGIDLGLGREIGKGENAPPVGQVRDTILDVLAQARVEDLLTAPGKEKLKADLLHALQERVPELQVEDVYFTEFLIQR